MLLDSASVASTLATFCVARHQANASSAHLSPSKRGIQSNHHRPKHLPASSRHPKHSRWSEWFDRSPAVLFASPTSMEAFPARMQPTSPGRLSISAAACARIDRREAHLHHSHARPLRWPRLQAAVGERRVWLSNSLRLTSTSRLSRLTI